VYSEVSDLFQQEKIRIYNHCVVALSRDFDGHLSEPLQMLYGSLRRILPGTFAFALGAFLFGEDSEVFLCGLLGHELPVVLEEHLGGVACF